MLLYPVHNLLMEFVAMRMATGLDDFKKTLDQFIQDNSISSWDG